MPVDYIADFKRGSLKRSAVEGRQYTHAWLVVTKLKNWNREGFYYNVTTGFVSRHELAPKALGRFRPSDVIHSEVVPCRLATKQELLLSLAGQAFATHYKRSMSEREV